MGWSEFTTSWQAHSGGHARRAGGHDEIRCAGAWRIRGGPGDEHRRRPRPRRVGRPARPRSDAANSQTPEIEDTTRIGACTSRTSCQPSSDKHAELASDALVRWTNPFAHTERAVSNGRRYSSTKIDGGNRTCAISAGEVPRQAIEQAPAARAPGSRALYRASRICRCRSCAGRGISSWRDGRRAGCRCIGRGKDVRVIRHGRPTSTTGASGRTAVAQSWLDDEVLIENTIGLAGGSRRHNDNGGASC